MDEFRRQAYPVSAIDIVCLLAVIPSPWATSAWLWFPGMVVALIGFSLTLCIIMRRKLAPIASGKWGHGSQVTVAVQPKCQL